MTDKKDKKLDEKKVDDKDNEKVEEKKPEDKFFGKSLILHFY
jgi:hypothetical protein